MSNINMRRQHLKLALPFPPSINAIYAPTRKGIMLTKRARDYHDLFKKTLEKQVEIETCRGFLEAKIWVCPPDRRKRDCDNILKILFDAMQKCEVYENDSQIKKVEVIMDHWPFPDGAVIIELIEIPFHDYENKDNSELLIKLQETRTKLGIPNKKDIPRPPPEKNPFMNLSDEDKVFWKEVEDNNKSIKKKRKT